MKFYVLGCFLIFCVSTGFASVGSPCKNDDDCDSLREICNNGESTSETMTTKAGRWRKFLRDPEPTTDAGASEDWDESIETTSESINAEEVSGGTAASVEDSASTYDRILRSSSRCECLDGYQVSKNKKQCVTPATEENEYSCETDADCELITVLKGYDHETEIKPSCVDQSCICGAKSGWLIHTCEDQPVCFKIPDLYEGSYECGYDEECSFLNNPETGTTASCVNSTCTCDELGWEFYEHESGTTCERAFFASCNKNQQCEHIENAACKKKKCQCKRKYFEGGNPWKCITEEPKSASSKIAVGFLTIILSIATVL